MNMALLAPDALPDSIPLNAEFVGQISTDAHRQLVEIHQIHSYAQVCLANKTITEQQFRSILRNLKEGWLSTAQGELVKALAVNVFVQQEAA